MRVAGLVLALHAAAEQADGTAVTILITADEEIGSPSSRDLIQTEAADCVAALVLEASAPGGAVKTERKGVSLYRVAAAGRAAHAGLEPERGINATVELASQILAVSALADPALGTTVSPTLMTAGNATNTIPDAGEFAVDVRVRDTAEQDRVDAPTLDGLGAVGDGAHADHEHVVIGELPNRAALVAALVASLGDSDTPSPATNSQAAFGTGQP